MKPTIARILLICLVAALLFACDHKLPAGPAAGRPVIIVSIFPVQSLVQQLTGDWADVQSLMPPGGNPHDFEPVASQIAPLSRADMLIVIGLKFDPWAERAGAQVGQPGMDVLRMADLIGAGAAAQSSAPANQHLWMDPVRTIRFVEALAPTLQKKYPAHSAEIARRQQTLVAELRSMDAQFRQELSAVREKKLISYHNAYDLLAERYGLAVVAHLTDIDLAPGGEVTPGELVQTIEAVKRFHLKVVYAEPTFPGRAMERIQQQAGVKVLALDDLGGPTVLGYDSYQALLRSDVKTLVEGQSVGE
jgi:zinc transport system substrate-binding protein